MQGYITKHLQKYKHSAPKNPVHSSYLVALALTASEQKNQCHKIIPTQLVMTKKFMARLWVDPILRLMH
jgi:hypothetical protein